MNIVPPPNLACPLDGAPLGTDGGRLFCAHGHSFDVARQGYVNLLPVQHKRSREPGDSKEMIAARARFLNAGLFAPISERLNGLVLEGVPGGGERCLVDAGCGEGYYLDRLRAALAPHDGGPVSLIGLDISKPAVAAAARRSRDITWLVASNRNPPLLSGSVDLICCMFGFPDYAAFARILKPGGRVVLVEAAEDHLIELRSVIYPEVRRSPPPDLAKAEAQGFRLVDRQPLRYRPAELDRPLIADLLAMTPHPYRAPPAGKQAAAQLDRIEVTVDVLFRVLELDAQQRPDERPA